jgi:KDO2-lipid IV(A) lauroyltransferase
MRKHKQRTFLAPSYFLEVFGVAIFYLFCKILGLDLSSRLGGWLGITLGPLFSRDKTARQNIQRAMIELSDEERDRIIKEMWYNTGRVFAEYAHLAKFQKPKYRDRIEFVYSPKARKAMEEHQGRCFFFSGHFTNWELMPLVLRFVNVEAVEIYQRISNPYINTWMHNLRQKAICSYQVEKSKAVRDILRHVKANRPFVALVDQKMLSGFWQWFFHQPALTSAFPATLAVKQNYALLPAQIERIDEKGKTKFRVTVHDPLEVDRTRKTKQDIAAVTQQVNYCLEAMIRAQPQNWLWFHNRWPDAGEQKRRARRYLDSQQRA